MLSGFLKITFGGLILWGAVTWLGAGLVALGIATLATLMASIVLDLTRFHTTELQRLREKITTLEESLDRAYERFSNDIDRLSEQNRRLSERFNNMKPTQFDDEY